MFDDFHIDECNVINIDTMSMANPGHGTRMSMPIGV